MPPATTQTSTNRTNTNHNPQRQYFIIQPPSFLSSTTSHKNNTNMSLGRGAGINKPAWMTQNNDDDGPTAATTGASDHNRRSSRSRSRDRDQFGRSAKGSSLREDHRRSRCVYFSLFVEVVMLWYPDSISDVTPWDIIHLTHTCHDSSLPSLETTIATMTVEDITIIAMIDAAEDVVIDVTMEGGGVVGIDLGFIFSKLWNYVMFIIFDYIIHVFG